MTGTSSRPSGPLKALAFCLAALAAGILILQLPSAAETRHVNEFDPRPGITEQAPKRHLILIGGGGFTRNDPAFEKQIVPEAIAHGFVPHYVRYRLNDVPGAIQDVRATARYLSSRYGPENVFAYGSSAGATLATTLAGEGRVSAAVASSALYDFERWPWVNLYWGQQYFDDVNIDRHAKQKFSPMHRPLRCPVFSMHGTADPVVSFFQAEDFVATHSRASLKLFFGGHGLYRSRPRSVDMGMRWLHKVGRVQARENREAQRTANLLSKGVQRADQRLHKFREHHTTSLCASPGGRAGSRIDVTDDGSGTVGGRLPR